MKKTSNFGWVQSLLLAPMVALALACCGCESEETDTTVDPARFVIDRELRNYSSTDEFVWDTTLAQALMTVRIDDFTEGDTAVRVYDGRGVLILVAALNTLDSVYFNGDDFYFQKRTDVGAPGQWHIVLDYHDFTGDINLTFE